MAELWILRALVFPLFVVTALTDENKDYDFRELLEEGKTIWVFNTTEPGNVTCKRDYINKIQGSNVSFTRHFKNNKEISKEFLEGVLFNWEHLEPQEGELYDSMKIKISEEHEIEEILEFVGDNGRCAVVKVMNVVNFNTDASKIWRELRVTNPEQDVKPSSECWKTFDEAVNITSKIGRKWRKSYINCK